MDNRKLNYINLSTLEHAVNELGTGDYVEQR